jgi:hypothetical protein
MARVSCECKHVQAGSEHKKGLEAIDPIKIDHRLRRLYRHQSSRCSQWSMQWASVAPECHQDRHWVRCQSGLEGKAEAHGRAVLLHHLLVDQIRSVHRVSHDEPYLLGEYHARMCSEKSRFEDDLAAVVKVLRWWNASIVRSYM